MRIGWMIRSGGVFGSVREAIEICNELTKLGNDVTIYTDKGKDQGWLANEVKWDKKENVLNGEFDYLVFSDSPDEPYFSLFKQAKSRLKSGCLMGFDGNPESLNTEKFNYLFKECWGICDGPWQLDYLEDGFAIGGVNVKQFAPQPVQKNVQVIWSGDFRKRKNSETVLKAIEGLTNDFYVGKNIPQDKLSEFICSGLIFADGHIRGGWCNPVMEAMACGMPIVCTDTLCNSDFTQDGYNCLKVAPGDHIAMRKAIDLLLNYRQLRHTLSVNAYFTAQHFDYRKIAKEFQAKILSKLST